MKLSSVCAVPRGSMEAKALSFVLHTVGSEHHQKSTRCVFTYVVGGRVGMNKKLFIFRSICRTLTPPTPMGVSDPAPMGANDPVWAQVIHFQWAQVILLPVLNGLSFLGERIS